MPTNLTQSLPPLDSSLRELLVRLADSLNLSDVTVAELGQAAFHRNWDAEMLKAWPKAKRAFGDRAPIPAGSIRQDIPMDPSNPWGLVELGTRHGVLPGQPVTNEMGVVVQAEMEGRVVSRDVFRRATEILLREQAAAFPNGTLAHDLAAFDEARRRLRQARALCRPLRPLQDRARIRPGPRRRREPRRAARRRTLRKALARSGDPPEPPPGVVSPSSQLSSCLRSAGSPHGPSARCWLGSHPSDAGRRCSGNSRIGDSDLVRRRMLLGRGAR